MELKREEVNLTKKSKPKKREVYKVAKKSPLKSVLIVMGLSLIVIVSCMAIFHREVETVAIKQLQDHPVQKLVPKAQRHQPTYNAESVLNVTPEDVYKVARDAPMMNQVAQIVIPSIAVDLPIQEGVDYYTELTGAGEQYPRSIVKPGEKGNYVLASHHIEGLWDTNLLFTSIHKLNENDVVYVNDENNIYTYKVINNEQVDVKDTSWIEQTPKSGKAYITLYTCVSDATSKVLRQVIRGELVATNKIDNKLPTEIKDAFLAQGFNQMTPWERSVLIR